MNKIWDFDKMRSKIGQYGRNISLMMFKLAIKTLKLAHDVVLVEIMLK